MKRKKSIGECSLPYEVNFRKKNDLCNGNMLSNLAKTFCPAIPTKVFISYWYLAAERQAIFFRRLEGQPPPWTNDPILQNYRFTNAYRASDRVSQYLIKNVIYKGIQIPEEIFFRTVLFRLFNKIETWKYLEKQLGEIKLSKDIYSKIDDMLNVAKNEGKRIFSNAYIMPSGTKNFSCNVKHSNWLKVIEMMIDDGLADRIRNTTSMRQVFELFKSYPMIGDFLGYQFSIDINYSTLTNHSEMEFVIPGPGARSGIKKCFTNLGGISEADLIRIVAERQNEIFDILDIRFKSLLGRPLQLIDCQNLFCEIDKYARVAFPEIDGLGNRTRIKQKYQANIAPIDYWYPPKWEISL